MASALEQVTALPTTGQLSRSGLRDMLTRRTALCLGASESLANFLVVDAATGVIPQFVIQNGTIYEYDPLDSTTVASATCLVSGDATGRRYKTGGITAPWSVLSATTSAQPVSPSVGDRYLVPTAATGTNWSGKDGQVAIYSRAGWQFATVPIGRGLYAEDTNIRYFRNAAGTWASGFGAVTIGSNSLNITNMLGANASFVVRVENQTTNTAPGSPAAFVAYIVGPTPAGAWSAYSPGDVAMCLTNGTWTRRIPQAGDQVFDKSLGYMVKWNGTSWTSASGAWLAHKYTQNSNSSTGTLVGSVAYGSFNPSSSPGSELRRIDSAVTTSYQSTRTGAVLRISYRSAVACSLPGGANKLALALYRDSGATAIDYCALNVVDGYNDATAVFLVSTPDALSHSYSVAVMHWDNANGPSSFARSILQIEERAQ